MEYRNQKWAEREKETWLVVGTFAIGKRSNSGKNYGYSLEEFCKWIKENWQFSFFCEDFIAVPKGEKGTDQNEKLYSQENLVRVKLGKIDPSLAIDRLFQLLYRVQ